MVWAHIVTESNVRMRHEKKSGATRRQHTTKNCHRYSWWQIFNFGRFFLLFCGCTSSFSTTLPAHSIVTTIVHSASNVCDRHACAKCIFIYAYSSGYLSTARWSNDMAGWPKINRVCRMHIILFLLQQNDKWKSVTSFGCFFFTSTSTAAASSYSGPTQSKQVIFVIYKNKIKYNHRLWLNDN